MLRLHKAAAIAVALIATGAAAQSKDAQDGPQPVGDPSRWFSPDDYPPDAKRAGEEGVVKFAVAVDATGTVTHCDVTNSSGSPALDAKTCELLRVNGRFSPAKDADGNPIAGVWSNSMGWQLANDASLDLTTGPFTKATQVRMTIDEDGRTVDCTTLSSKGPVKDGCIGFYPDRFTVPRLFVDGMPVRGTVTVTTTSTFEPLPEKQRAP